MKRIFTVWILLTLFAQIKSTAASPPDVVSPLTSFTYLDDAVETPTQPNIVSALVSYLFEDTTSIVPEQPNVISPLTSYLYLDTIGSNGSEAKSSVVDYYYQFQNAPQITIIPTQRVATTAETTLPMLNPIPQISQLKVFTNGFFTNIVSLDSNEMTIVLTHGWQPKFPSSNVRAIDDWPTHFANTLTEIGINANIIGWDWNEAATTLLPGAAAGEAATNQGPVLGKALQHFLGETYAGNIHFVGHSMGTLLNSRAATFLHKEPWNGEEIANVRWLPERTHLTLLDEAEAGTDMGALLAIATLAKLNGNPLEPRPWYDHPLPKHFRWSDNYISAFGLLQSNSVNLILTNRFPGSVSNPIYPITVLGGGFWLGAMRKFHGYPIDWYINTLSSTTLKAGFPWSFERAADFSQNPPGSVFKEQGQELKFDIASVDWQTGVDELNKRFEIYLTELDVAFLPILPVSALAYAEVYAELLTTSIESSFDNFEMKISKVLVGADPSKKNAFAKSSSPQGSVWMQLQIPDDAAFLTFDYKVQGDCQTETLSFALNGTNVATVSGGALQTNQFFRSDLIDVSSSAGSTAELFVGLIGPSETASVTIANLVVSRSVGPTLRAESSGSTIKLRWPVASADYALESATRINDPSEWTAASEAIVIEGLENTVTVQSSETNRFFRLTRRPGL